MVRYYSPNSHLTEKKWNTVLKEYIPNFINANDELAYENTTLQLTGETHDSHANLWNGDDKLEEFVGTKIVPTRIQFMENEFVIVGFYNTEFEKLNTFLIGDVLTKVNGVSVKNLIKKRQLLHPASNQASFLRDIAKSLLRTNEDVVDVTVMRNGKEVIVKAPTSNYKETLTAYYKSIPSSKPSYKILEEILATLRLKPLQLKNLKK